MTSFTSSFGLSEARAAAMAVMGPNLDANVTGATRALFEGTWDLSLPKGGARFDDLPYGDHPRQFLDLFTPGGANAPILLFVHGGGFVAGDNRMNEHIGFFFARAGFVTAVMNYRFAPEYGWPAGAQDVSAALDWLAGHAADHGADGGRIVVFGQSAGATHSSGALFDASLRPRCHSAVRAAVLTSGLFEMRADLGIPGVMGYFGNDPAQYVARSPIHQLAGSTVPVMLTLAELDPPFIVRSVLDMARALGARDGRASPLAWLKGHNHLSPVLSIGSSGDALGSAIVQALAPFIAKTQ